MPLQEVVLCSLAPTANTGVGLISLHDIQTGSPLASFKQSSSTTHCTAHVETKNGLGGIILASQTSKALLNVYSFQKDQLMSKIVLPEMLSCIDVDSHGSYCAAGTSSGRLYLWEISSGILFNSFEAHYRRVSVLKFTQDGAALISGSEDSSVSVWSMPRLLDEDLQNEIPSPHCSFTEHTLTITDIVCGTGTFPSCRAFTSSLDHTVKVWDLSTRSILTSIIFPNPITILVVDPTERFILAASQEGSIHQFNLFKKGPDVLKPTEAVGGGGMSDIIRISDEESTNQRLISVGQNITTLSLSLNASLLLVGTTLGQILIYDVASHQLLRSINNFKDKGYEISYLITLLKPPDLLGHVSLGDRGVSAGEQDPVRPVAQFHKIKDVSARIAHELPLILPICETNPPKSLPSWGELLQEQSYFLPDTVSIASNGASLQSRVSELEGEVAKLKEQLGAAKGLNDSMWESVVQKMINQDGQEMEADDVERYRKKFKRLG